MAKASPDTPQSIAPMERPPPVSTRPQGSSPERTPSMIVFIKVACGAGRSRVPKEYALPRSSTVAATAQHANAAPNLASTLNQGAFNLGNATGAWIGSGMLAAGAPLADLPWAGAAITLGALALAAWSSRLGDRTPSLQAA